MKATKTSTKSQKAVKTTSKKVIAAKKTKAVPVVKASVASLASSLKATKTAKVAGSMPSKATADELKPQTSMKMPKLRWLIALVILSAGVLLLRKQMIVAWVNGAPIFRWSVVEQLEKTAGKQTAEQIVTKMLIMQEAAKQNIAVTDEEITAELDKIKKTFTDNNQDFAALLTAQNVTEAEVRDQIKLQKVVEKLAGSGIQVTDQQVDDYIKTNKEFLPEGVTGDELKKQVREQLVSQEVNTKIQEYVTNLRTGAAVNYWLYE